MLGVLSKQYKQATRAGNSCGTMASFRRAGSAARVRIAFDLRRIGNPGIGRYMRCLVEAVLAAGGRHEYLLILPARGEGSFVTIAGSRGPNVERIVCPAAPYSVREQIDLPRLLRRHAADVLHVPHFNLPLLRTCPAVVT